MWAPSLWAFFYLGPLVPFPVRDGLVVALNGTPFGDLARPVRVAQDAPDMVGMMLYAKFLLDYRSDPLQGPEFVGVAVGQGPLQ